MTRPGFYSGKLSRRALLAAGCALPGALRANGRGMRIPAPAKELSDPLTERKLWRLTDPEALHHLPHFHNRYLSRKNDLLLVGGELAGSRQIYQLEIERERLTQLTEGPDVHSYAACLDSRERSFFYMQGDRLLEGSLRGRGEKDIYESPSGWRLTGHLSVTSDDRLIAFIEMRDGDQIDNPLEQFKRRPRCRLRVVETSGRAEARTLSEEDAWLAHPQFRPGGTDLIYSREGPWGEVDGRIQHVALDGTRTGLTPREGEEQIGHELWSADGSLIYFVRYPGRGYRGAEVRVLAPEDAAQRVVSPCSAFGWMQINLDGTTFVGASRRPSGPNNYVLFTKLRREITVSEHGSSLKPHPIAGTDRLDYDCAQPEPVISADSQWLYFATDREGKPAVYRQKLEDLVSET